MTLFSGHGNLKLIRKSAILLAQTNLKDGHRCVWPFLSSSNYSLYRHNPDTISIEIGCCEEVIMTTSLHDDANFGFLRVLHVDVVHGIVCHMSPLFLVRLEPVVQQNIPSTKTTQRRTKLRYNASHKRIVKTS